MFSDAGFMPQIQCYTAKPLLIWNLVLTNGILVLSLVTIAVILFSLFRRVRFQFSSAILWFGLYLTVSACTRVMEIWTMWNPDFWAYAALKAVGAIAALGTAFSIFKLRRQMIAFVDSAHLSEERRHELERLTAILEEKVEERSTAAELSTHRWHLTADALPALVAYVDREERYRSVNSAYERWFGAARADIVGKTMSEVLGPELYAEVRPHIRRALLGEPTKFEPNVAYTRGATYFEASYIPDFSATGEVLGFVVLVNDITDRKEAEEGLKRLALEAERSRAQLEAVFQSVNEGIAVFDMKGSVVLLNDAEAKICGFESASELKRDLTYFEQVFQLARSDDPDSVLPPSEWPVSCVLRGEVVHDVELRATRIDTGQSWWFHFSGGPVIDADGNQILALVVTRDITQEKIAQHALQENEARFRTYVEAMPQMAFVADGEGHLVYFNRRFYDYLGQHGVMGDGRAWASDEIYHPDDLPRTIETWTESLRTGKRYQIEYRLRRFDGEYRWHLGRAVPVRDRVGKIQQWLGTNTDIHDQKETARKLEQAIAARDEFLSIASHELKTPIASLRLQTQLFQRGLQRQDPRILTPERIRKLIEQTDRQTSRLTRLVDDMLDIARIRSGRLSIQPEPIVLGDLVTEAVDRMKPTLAQLATPVEIAIEDRVEGTWDRLRVEQIVMNLLTNAMRYGEKKLIRVGLRRVGQFARLSVKDHGIGISKEARERIFNRFEREVSANEVSGLGLGLFITRQIVEVHGGRIWVESPGVGEGATFFVDLPIQPQVPAYRPEELSH